MKKNLIYLLIWPIVIFIFIVTLRVLKVEVNGESDHWFVGIYIVIGGLYSSLVVTPVFLLIDYFGYKPRIKKKLMLNSVRFFTLLFIIMLVAVVEHYYF